MLTLALCIFPNPFFLLSADPYEALWRTAALCAALLGIETIVLFWRIGRSPLAWVTLVVAGGSVVLAVIAGRQAVIGLVCASIPNAPASLVRKAEASLNLLVALQWCGIAACLVTAVLLVLGGLRLVGRPHMS